MPTGNHSAQGEVTQLLNRLSEGSEVEKNRAMDQLIPLIYGELKALARSNRYRWNEEPAPGTTSLVHEAYARLADRPGAGYESRRQFFKVVSKAMRSILIDNARRYRCRKRGGGVATVEIDDERLMSAERCDELLALDAALDELAERQPQLADVVECRCFGGLTVEETAEALAISATTVKRRWRLARTWLYCSMQPETG
jgi:RNA polymerase sigma factor (TIGR02999 family)